MDLFIEMGPLMFEKQVKESQSRAAPLSLPRRGCGCDVMTQSVEVTNLDRLNEQPVIGNHSFQQSIG